MITLDILPLSSTSDLRSEVYATSIRPPLKIQFGGRSFVKNYSTHLLSYEDSEKIVHKIRKKKVIEIKEAEENDDKEIPFVKHKGKFKDTPDLYKILGLGSIRWKATDDQIRKGYHESCRKYHPDQSDTPDDEMFKKVQEAWEILRDKRERQLYDSAVEVNVVIPRNLIRRKKIMTFSKFLKSFKPLFQEWRRWSGNSVLPYFGGEDEPIESIKNYYDQWFYHFKSWRDFSWLGSDGGMHDLLEADDRFEKRWMVKENEKKERKYKKQEKEDIQKLVKIAQNLDPRYQNYLKEEKLKLKMMEKKKEDKRNKKMLEKFDEENKLLEIEKQKKLEQSKKKKEERKKKKIQEERKKEVQKFLREICEKYFIFDKNLLNEKKSRNKNEEQKKLPKILCEYFETLMLFCGLKELEECLKKCKSYQEKNEIFELCKLINKAGRTIIKRREKKRKQAEEERKKEKERKKKKNVEKAGKWTREELRILMDCLVRFPSGTPNRFEKISAKVGKLAKDCQLKMKILKREKPIEFMQTKSFESPSVSISVEEDENNWSNDQQVSFEKALRMYLKKEDPFKWEKIAGFVEGKNEIQCKEHFRKCREIAMKRRKNNIKK